MALLANTGNREQLQKSTSPAQIWALALGAMIGWGCFVLPDLYFLPTSGPIGGILGIGLGAFMICIVALCCGMLIKLYPVAGGTFVYSYVGLGPTAAFICGWGVVLTYTCAIAANGTALVLLFRFLFPGALAFGHLYTIMGWDIYIGEVIVIVGILTFFCYCNVRGMNLASNIQLSLSCALVVGILILFMGAVTTDSAAVSNLQPYFAETKSPIACVFAIFAWAPFLFGGFDTIPQAAEEFNFPISKSTSLMLAAIISGGVMYGLVILAVAIVNPYPEQLALQSPWLVGNVAEHVFGKIGGLILAVPVMAAIFSGINGFIMATSRLLFGMGRAKFLPAWFQKLSKRYNTPVNAIIFVWCFIIIAPGLGRPFLGWLSDTMALSLGLSYFMACITAYRLTVQRPDLVTMPLAKPIALLGIVLSLACLLFLAVPGSPAAIGLFAVGVCVFWIVLGVVFYRKTCTDIRNMTQEEICMLLFGRTDVPILFSRKK